VAIVEPFCANLQPIYDKVSAQQLFVCNFYNFLFFPTLVRFQPKRLAYEAHFAEVQVAVVFDLKGNVPSTAQTALHVTSESRKAVQFRSPRKIVFPVGGAAMLHSKFVRMFSVGFVPGLRCWTSSLRGFFVAVGRGRATEICCVGS
jgi:hypothetical protein